MSALVERHLSNWADWMRAGSDNNLGYPKRAAVALGGGQSVSGVVDEICDACDTAAAEAVDTLIHDLPLYMRRVIYYKWLGCAYIAESDYYLAEAYAILDRKITKRGMC